MPTHQGRDSNGSYYQWGNHGKRYYYVTGNKRSRELARNKANRQGVAIKASGWR